MFGKNSRYYELEKVTGKDRMGRPVQSVKLRRLSDTTGKEMLVTDGTQLDILSERLYKDPTQFWHIADANTELGANELVLTTGRIIKVPER